MHSLTTHPTLTLVLFFLLWWTLCYLIVRPLLRYFDA